MPTLLNQARSLRLSPGYLEDSDMAFWSITPYYCFYILGTPNRVGLILRQMKRKFCCNSRHCISSFIHLYFESGRWRVGRELVEVSRRFDGSIWEVKPDTRIDMYDIPVFNLEKLLQA